MKTKKRRPYIEATCEFCGQEKTIREVLKCYEAHSKQWPELTFLLCKQGATLRLEVRS